MKRMLTFGLLIVVAIPLMATSVCGGEYISSPSHEGNARLAPVWSPDGERIVFPYLYRLLYTVEADGSNLQLISRPDDDDEYADFSPDVSPDGTRVVFVTSRHGPRFFFSDWRSLEIASSALDGSDYRRLTNHEALDSNPSWSPDGNRIAFVSDRDNTRGGVFTMAADGSDVRAITPPSLIVTQDSPLWSPDGRYMAFFTWGEERGKVLHTVATDGSSLTRIASAQLAAWSPDGTRIAFVATTDEFTLDLHTANPDGSDVRKVTQGAGFAVNRLPEPRLFWSADGSEITFLGERSPPGEKLVNGIYAIRMDGSGYRTIAEDVNRGHLMTVSPDGSRIAVRPERNWSIVLYTVAADGSDARGLVWDLSEPDPRVDPRQPPAVESVVTEATAPGELTQPEPLVE